ncbi:MAG: LamG domain-containing protein [Spirochaetota bacterium]
MKDRRLTRCAAGLVLGVLLVGATPLLADRLELENGDVLSGDIVRMDDETVTIETEYGRLEVPRDHVRHGAFGEAIDSDEEDERPDTSSGLVFRFTLDDTLESTVGDYTLTNNGLRFAPDRGGTPRAAARSDGSATYLSLPPAPEINELSTFTLVFHLRLESTRGTKYLVSKWDRAEGETAEGKFTIQTSSGGVTLFLVGPDGRYRRLSARGVLAPLVWHTVAVSFAAGRAAIYVDGEEVGSRTFAFTELYPDDSPLLIMTAEATTDDPYGHYNVTGSIDDIRLYSRALAPEEIAAIASGEE